MNFHGAMDFDLRMKNLSRLTPKGNDCYNERRVFEANSILEKMWQATVEFQEKFSRKKRLKKKLKFWQS
jgi:hypothetical protein